MSRNLYGFGTDEILAAEAVRRALASRTLVRLIRAQRRDVVTVTCGKFTLFGSCFLFLPKWRHKRRLVAQCGCKYTFKSMLFYLGKRYIDVIL